MSSERQRHFSHYTGFPTGWRQTILMVENSKLQNSLPLSLELSLKPVADEISLSPLVSAAGWLDVAWCRNRVITNGNDWPDIDMYLWRISNAFTRHSDASRRSEYGTCWINNRTAATCRVLPHDNKHQQNLSAFSVILLQILHTAFCYHHPPKGLCRLVPLF